MAHHFAHESVPDSLRSCQETALHEVAKIVAAQIIPHLHVPQRSEAFQTTEKLITEEGVYRAVSDSVSLKSGDVQRLAGTVEPIVPEVSPYRPDAKVQTLTGDIYVEIHVTNPVTPEKQNAMVEADLAVLEVDLSNVPRAGLTLDEIERLVISEAPRKWVSLGLRRWVERARLSLDEAVREKEGMNHKAMLRQLRETPMANVRSPVTVSSLQHKFSDRGIWINCQIPVENVRCEKGFWLADLPNAPGALLTSITDDVMLNRLFGWYQTIRSQKLTVLSMGETNTVYSNDFETVEAMLRHNQSDLPDRIPSLQLVDGAQSKYKLEHPLTPAKLRALGGKIYIADYVSQDLARELILNDFTDVVISHFQQGWVAYAPTKVAKWFDSVRPGNGTREQILYRVRYGDPCLVRFVPSLPDRLKGDVFDLLRVQNDEVYLDDPLYGPISVHFDRADFWKNGGILILPDPMRRGAYHLEPSNNYLRDMKTQNLE